MDKKVRLIEKGSFVNVDFDINAGEQFHCYFRIYEIDGCAVRIEKANQLSRYGMKKLPEWTIVDNNTPLVHFEIKNLLNAKYKNLRVS